jgi:hypothetical protein
MFVSINAGQLGRGFKKTFIVDPACVSAIIRDVEADAPEWTIVLSSGSHLRAVSEKGADSFQEVLDKLNIEV